MDLSPLSLHETRKAPSLYSWHRHFNHHQWLSEDPIGFLGGQSNIRQYSGNVAPSTIDPTGLKPVFNGKKADVRKAEEIWAAITAMAAKLREAAIDSRSRTQNSDPFMKQFIEEWESVADTVDKINAPDVTVSISVVSGDNKPKDVIVGNFDLKAIDMDAVPKFPPDCALSPTVIMMHEVYEQYLNQVMHMDKIGAHNKALAMEQMILGMGPFKRTRDETMQEIIPGLNNGTFTIRSFYRTPKLGGLSFGEIVDGYNIYEVLEVTINTSDNTVIDVKKHETKIRK